MSQLCLQFSNTIGFGAVLLQAVRTIPPPKEERIAVWNQGSSEAVAIARYSDLTFDEIHVDLTKGKYGMLHPTILIRILDTDQRLSKHPTLLSMGKISEREKPRDMYVLVIGSQDTKKDYAYITAPDDYLIVRL